MTDNSIFEPVLLAAEREVTVVGEEHHQQVLARYAAPGGTANGRVAAELRSAPVMLGPHAGQRGIEVLLDGYRVGELTFRMAQSYGHVVAQATRDGRRVICHAVVKHGRRGLVELELRLPHLGTLPPLPVPGMRGAGTHPAPAPAPAGPAPRRTHKRVLWGGGFAVAAAVAIASVNGGPTPPPAAAPTSTQVAGPAAALNPAAPQVTAAVEPTSAVPTGAVPTSAVPTSAVPTSAAPKPRATKQVRPPPVTVTRPPSVRGAGGPTTPPTRTRTPVAAEQEPARSTTSATSYQSCAEARAAGVTPLHRGEPGYAPKLDRDNDGVACE